MNIISKKEAFTLIELIIVIAIIAIIATSLFVAVNPAKRIGESRDSQRWSDLTAISKSLEKYTADYTQEYCTVMGASLFGEVTTYNILSEDEEAPATGTSADYLTWAINDMDNDPNVWAIVVDIDSWGGSGVAGEEIAQALKDAEKPTVAWVRDAAVSAAYWAASGADYIVASAMSEIGGIGINGSYLDNVEQNKLEGLTYNQLTSAKFKDSGDPNRKMTAEEIAIWERDMAIMHEHFVNELSKNRGLELEKVRELADGSTMMGQMAFDNGLIDEVGGWDEVFDYIQTQVDVKDDDSVCWY